MKDRILGPARLVIGIVASLVLGWLSVRGLEWGLVWENLASVSVIHILLAVAIFMLAGWVRAVRWRILFVNEKLSVARLFIVQHEGLGLSNIMPVRVVSEVTQLAVLTLKDGLRGSTALVAIGMERLVDSAASVLVLAVAVSFVHEMEQFRFLIWVAIGIIVLAVALFRLFAWGGESIAFIRRIAFLAAMAQSVKTYGGQRLRLLSSFLVSIVYWLLVGVSAWIVAVAFNLDVSPIKVTFVTMATIFFITAIPAAPSGIGAFEAAVVYLLGLLGVGKADAFGFALVVHAVFFVPPTVIAVIFLPREGVSLRRKQKLVVVASGTANPGQGN
ncbi:MAG: flippase-like domain-containing protein [SAR202 cluster bacterium]|nr:flippase-like domain-containing protein [SAR202 cluster bacterium]